MPLSQSNRFRNGSVRAGYTKGTLGSVDGRVTQGSERIYGSDDDTLFRLITLGTGSLSPGNAFQKQGFVRKGSENVVGPMPPYGEIIPTEDDIWKIIAWIRSKHCEQDPARC